jgi:alpha-beta hydrolase superfamily lysophospholipase
VTVVHEVVDFGRTRAGVTQLRRHWRSPHPQAVMLLVHGIDEHSGRYAHFAEVLGAQGIDVVAIDLVGFGGSGGRRGYVDSFEQYVDDAVDQLVEVRRLGLPTVLYGHSMGGLIALLAVLRDGGPKPDALVLSAPALAAGIPKPLRRVAPLAARVAPRLPVPSPIVASLLASDPHVAEEYRADPANVRVTTPALGADLLRAMDAANADLHDLGMPTLVVHGGDDRLVPTASSEPLAALPGVERRVYPGLRHEVHNERTGDDVVRDIGQWIRAHLPPR